MVHTALTSGSPPAPSAGPVAGTGPDVDQAAPDVSVVVPVFDDPLVEQAIASALHQTLRTVEVVVVDHGSTDGTGALVDRIAARDSRVRAFHLPDNEGGPGRPLNVGLAAARGRYVTILGSDDELERDACRTLLAAAEVDGADVVTSLTRRIHVHEGNRVQPWYPVLYGRRRTLEGIRADLEQIWDQIPVGKLYRTSWMREHEVRFPEDVVYEDQLFMMRAYLRAARISVVPVPTYLWMVRSKAARRSITHSRSDIRNLLDRIAVNERIDALLAEEGAGDIKPWKDRKFLRHDLKMYLQELWQRDDAYRRAFGEVAGRYLRTVPDDVLAGETTPLRVALWLLRGGDVEGAVSAYGYVQGRGRVATELVRDDGRVYWTSRHLDTEEGRRWLDVTDLGLDRIAPAVMHLFNQMTFTQAEGGLLEVSGTVLNQFGVIPESADVRLHVVVKARRGGRQVRFRATDVVREGSTIRFRASLDLGTRLELGLRRSQIFDVYLESAWDGQVNLTRTTATAGGWPGITVTVASRRRVLVGDTLVPYATRAGNLSFQLTPSSVTSARIGDPRRRRRAGRRRCARSGAPTGRRCGRGPRSPTTRPARGCPSRRSTVLFEAFEGRQYSDSPRAVYEALRRMHPELDVVWSYSARRGPSGFPKDATLVQRGEHGVLQDAGDGAATGWTTTACPELPAPAGDDLRADLARHAAEDALLRHRAGPEPPQEEQDAWQEFLDRWDYVGHPERLLREHLPALQQQPGGPDPGRPAAQRRARDGNDSETIDRLKRQLGLPTDRRIVLYAPTYRPAPLAPEFRYPDLTELAAGSGEDHVLLHPPALLPPRVRRSAVAGVVRARRVRQLDEMSQLLLVSDVLAHRLLLRRLRLRLPAAADGLLRPATSSSTRTSRPAHTSSSEDRPGHSSGPPRSSSRRSATPRRARTRTRRGTRRSSSASARPTTARGRAGGRGGLGPGRAQAGAGRGCVVDHHGVDAGGRQQRRSRPHPGTTRAPACPPRERRPGPAARPVAGRTRRRTGRWDEGAHLAGRRRPCRAGRRRRPRCAAGSGTRSGARAAPPDAPLQLEQRGGVEGRDEQRAPRRLAARPAARARRPLTARRSAPASSSELFRSMSTPATSAAPPARPQVVDPAAPQLVHGPSDRQVFRRGRPGRGAAPGPSEQRWTSSSTQLNPACTAAVREAIVFSRGRGRCGRRTPRWPMTVGRSWNSGSRSRIATPAAGRRPAGPAGRTACAPPRRSARCSRRRQPGPRSTPCAPRAGGPARVRVELRRDEGAEAGDDARVHDVASGRQRRRHLQRLRVPDVGEDDGAVPAAGTDGPGPPRRRR